VTTLSTLRHPAAGAAPTLLAIGSATAALLAIGLPDAAWARATVAVVLAATLVMVAVRDPAAGILATTGFLAVLGLLRRLVSMVQADPANDPLLLVAPVAAVVLAGLAVRDGAFRRPSHLTGAVIAFFVLSVVAVFNPASPLAVNLKGSLFWTVPLLWFAVGRSLVDDPLLDRVLRLVTGLGFGACLTGVLQATVGFPSWDDRWIETRGYIALGINGPGTLRPFGWSSSAGEFALTAAIVAVLAGLQVARAIGKRARRDLAFFTVVAAVATAALVLSAVRTALILGVAAAVVVGIASQRAHLRRTVAGFALALLLLLAGVRVLDVPSWDNNGVTGLVRRSLVGFTDPLDPDQSTLRSHIDLTDRALRNLGDDPLGLGPSAGATGTDTDDEQSSASAENDLGNAALAFGIPGLVLVIVITGLGLVASWRAARLRHSLITLGVLGILVASLRFWWTGGHYAIAMLIWLVLGSTDRHRATAPPPLDRSAVPTHLDRPVPR
jgi:hypothetical protein